MRDKWAENLVDKVVAEFVRLRKEQGLSHEALAKKIGVSRPAISFIESGKRTPKLMTCAKIAKGLGVRLTDILDEIEHK